MTITGEKDESNLFWWKRSILCEELHFCFRQMIWQKTLEGLHIIKDYSGG